MNLNICKAINAWLRRMQRAKIYRGERIIEGLLACGKRSVALRLYHDSGNLLATYGGEAVIVIKDEYYAYLFGISAARFDDLPAALTAASLLSERERAQTLLLGASTINGQTILLVHRADNLFLPAFGKNVSPIYVAAGAIGSDAFDGIANMDMIY